MFIIDATFEDTRIHAQSRDGKDYRLQVSDNHTGEIAEDVTITALQMSYILQMSLHNDGEPEGFEKMYESLEPIFKDWPTHLRPIP
jgi:hypothetical protein